MLLTNTMLALRVRLPAVAVSVAWLFAVTVDVTTEKVAELEAAGIVTLAGTDKDGWLLLSETTSAASAGLSNRTVQTLVALLPRVDAAHESPANCAVVELATRVRVKVCVLPPNVAVITADWLAAAAPLKFPVDAVNVALLWFAATVTPEGTLTAAFPLLIATGVATAAVWFSATVQVLAALLPSVPGAQESPVRVSEPGMGAGKEIDPEPPLAGIEVPAAVDATTPVI
jgi:hypothetical protein